jgi:hypothetical protein
MAAAHTALVCSAYLHTTQATEPSYCIIINTEHHSKLNEFIIIIVNNKQEQQSRASKEQVKSNNCKRGALGSLSQGNICLLVSLIWDLTRDLGCRIIWDLVLGFEEL